MIGWAIFGTYLLGLVLTTRAASRWLLNNMAGRLDNGDRWFCLVVGFLLSLAWPAVIMGWAIGHKPVSWLKTDREIAEAKDAELAALRKLARDHGLPYPEVK